MAWIVVEALMALLVGVLIVWWTMFSGRPGGERPDDESRSPPGPTGAAGAGELTPDTSDATACASNAEGGSDGGQGDGGD